MADYITLLGAEQVQRASHNMQAAAESMMGAAREMHGVLDRLERILAEDREARVADYERMNPR